MPRQEFTSPEPKSDIYALMMVLSAVFILAAILITYAELANDYDFYGTEGAVPTSSSSSSDEEAGSSDEEAGGGGEEGGAGGGGD